MIKRTFNYLAIAILMTICSTVSALAGNNLVLGDGGPITIKPGEEKEIEVNMTNDDVIYAMQFDMKLTSSKIEIVEGSLKINEDRIDRESFMATLYHMNAANDYKWRISFLTKDFSPIMGKEGPLATFKIKASESFTTNDNATIKFSTCSGADENGKKVAIDCPKYQAVTPYVGNLTTSEKAFSIKPGGTHKVDVVMNNEIYFNGMQTDITLPKGLQIEKKANGKFKFEYSDRLSSNFAISSLEKDGKVRIVLSSLPIDKITKGEGAIFSFNVVADADFVSDENTVITFSNTLAATETSEYSLDCTEANIVVTSMKPANDAAYTRLTEELAALQKALDEAKAKVAEECKDVADNYKETIDAIQAQIDAIKNDLDKKNTDCDLTEESVLDADAVKAINEAIEKYIADAQAAQAEVLKKAANDAAYTRLSEELTALQARFDEVKNIINTEYKTVAAQFAGIEANIQYDINKVKSDLDKKNENVELDENSTLDLQTIKDAIEQLLEDAKKANETAGISSIAGVDKAEISGVYSLSGNLVETPVKGNAYIVRLANGKTMKVFVR